MRKGILFKLARSLYRWVKYRLIPERAFIMYTYKKRFGYFPDLKNPKTFNEILQWKKLHDKRSIYSVVADKYAVREYVSKKIGNNYLIPLLGAYSNVDDIPFDKLTENLVIKPNHMSNKVIFIKERVNDFTDIKKEMTGWLKDNLYYYGKEWQYKYIVPKIIIEYLLTDTVNGAPFDYKLHCFNGKVVFIQVDIGRFVNHKRNLYNRKWELLPTKYIYDNGVNVPKPNNLKKMIDLAEKLSEDFDYIRVDLYCVNEQIYFGELTLTPESGFGCFYPPEFDSYLGRKLKTTFS